MASSRKAPSRGALKKRALAAASKVSVPPTCDVCVVGGGAAGLAAAISAAEEGARTVVFERDASCGERILATGNGRCNFCNDNLDPNHYNDPAFVAQVCGTHYKEDVLSFFRDSGLAWTSDEGRHYPLSRQAASVRNVLLRRAQSAGVVLAPAREVTEVCPGDPKGRPFEIIATDAFSTGMGTTMVHAQTLVLATGGTASSNAVLQLVQGLHLAGHEARPVLCPLSIRDSPLLGIDGRRAHVVATLWREEKPLYQEAGEILFRSYGVSGIVVFDLSRRVRAGDTLTLDLIPSISAQEASALAHRLGGYLDGMMDPTIAKLLLKLAGKHWWEKGSCVAPPHATDALDYALHLAKRLPLVVQGVADTKHAQVMRGGLANDQFDPHTLECEKRPNLFACGEALDVDADCGGYNLAWAWKSGMVAGTEAAKVAQGKIRARSNER